VISFYTSLYKLGPTQQMAIQSWRASVPDCEVLFFGSASDAMSTGLEMHSVEVSETGKPIVSDLFRAARAAAQFNVLCYINADIVVTPRLFEAALVVNGEVPPPWMILGQRWDTTVDYDVDFQDPEWGDRLISSVMADKRTRLHPTSGMDYFITRGDVWGDEIPPYKLGCFAWDTDLMCIALERNVPVIDATIVNPVFHLDHKIFNRRDTPDAKYNLELLGRDGDFHTRLRGTQHATWTMGPDFEIREK